MSSLAPVRPRGGFLLRLQCGRSGHRWERQVLDSGAEARWVCTTCGKLGDEIPMITPEQEVVEMSDAPETPVSVDEETVLETDPVAEPETVPEASEEPEVVSAAPADEDDVPASRLRPVAKVATVAVVSAAVIGAGVLAFRRFRR